MKRKLLSCIIAMLMVFTSLVPTVITKAEQYGDSKDINIEFESEYEKEGVTDGLEYGIKDGEAYIIGYTADLPNNVVIPEKIEECPVKSIARSAFIHCSKIREINTANVEFIDNSAFLSCSNLIIAQMPEVEYIGQLCFFYCDELEGVEMPKVKYVASDAFEETLYLRSFTDEFVIVGDGVLIKYNGTERDVMLPDEVKVAGGFYLNQTVVTVNTNNATIVSEGAFLGAEGLVSVDMPNIITVCGCAFISNEYISNLRSINMLKAETIGREAFANCSSLENVEMPKVRIVEKEAFDGCRALRSITLPEVKKIDDSAFSYSALVSISMPKVEDVGNYVFCECLQLEKVEMPKLKSIGNGVFDNCLFLNEIVISSDNQDFSSEGGILYNKDKTKLYYYTAAKGSVTVSDSVKEIGNGAFSFDSNLKEIKLPNVEMVEEFAFSNCIELQKVYMPKVKELKVGAFWLCEKVERVDFYSLERIEDGAVAGHSLKAVYFHCKAPAYCDKNAFMPFSEDFCIYFDRGMEGFTGYTWNGYTSQCIDPETEEILPSLFGDASGDCIINTTDAVHILKKVVNLVKFTDEQCKMADADKDGYVTTADAVCILRFVAGLISEL